jgi:uncharacterized protein (TIGR02996 family)
MTDAPSLFAIRKRLEKSSDEGARRQIATDLAALLGDDQPPLVQRGAAQIAAVLGVAAKPAVPALVHMLQTRGAELYGCVYPAALAAAEALEALAPQLTVPTPLEALLVGPGPVDGDARWTRAVWDAVAAKREDPVPSLMALIEAQGEKAPEAAVAWLGFLGPAAAGARALVLRSTRETRDGYWRLRWVAALALQRIDRGTDAGTSVLRATLGNHRTLADVEVGLAAADVLLAAGHAREEALAHVRRALDQPRHRDYALEVLTRWHGPVEPVSLAPPSAAALARDDAARLVWADQLLESDDAATRARGELVQIQCEVARQWDDDSPRLIELLRHEDRILRAHGAAWIAAEMPPKMLEGRSTSSFELRRGIIEAVRLGRVTAADVELLAARGVRALLATVAPDELSALGASAAAQQLVELEIGASQLVRLAPFSALTHLGLFVPSGVRLDWESLDGALPALRSLSLTTRPGFTGLDAFLGCELVSRVERLRVFLCRDDDIRPLVRLGELHRLRWLDIEFVGSVAPVHQILAASPVLERLHGLTTRGQATDDTTTMWRIVTNAPLLGEIRLNVVQHKPEAFERLVVALARAPRRALSLRAMGIGDAELRLLLEQLPEGLTELDLTGNHLQPRGIAQLASTPRMRTLRTLMIGGNAIGAAGEEALVRSPHLSSLRSLHMSPYWPSGPLRERFGYAIAEERPGKFPPSYL